MDQIYNINIASKDSRVPFATVSAQLQQIPSAQGGIPSLMTAAGKLVDPNIVNYVYNRFIEGLQVDRNLSIESILRQEPVAS